MPTDNCVRLTEGIHLTRSVKMSSVLYPSSAKGTQYLLKTSSESYQLMTEIDEICTQISIIEGLEASPADEN